MTPVPPHLQTLLPWREGMQPRPALAPCLTDLLCHSLYLVSSGIRRARGQTSLPDPPPAPGFSGCVAQGFLPPALTASLSYDLDPCVSLQEGRTLRPCNSVEDTEALPTICSLGQLVKWSGNYQGKADMIGRVCK